MFYTLTAYFYISALLNYIFPTRIAPLFTGNYISEHGSFLMRKAAISFAFSDSKDQPLSSVFTQLPIRLSVYRQMYWNLFDLLQKAYMDRYLLEELSKYNEEIKQHENAYKTHSYSVIGHMFVSLKNDLCLTLWKIYYDKNPAALTIRSLNSYLWKITQKDYETKLPKHLRIYENTINKVRKQYLAHNDREKENVRIQLNDLYAILDELCIMLDAMCEKDVDTGVVHFSEGTKNALKKRCTQGLAKMIYHDDQPIAIRIPLQDE